MKKKAPKKTPKKKRGFKLPPHEYSFVVSTLSQKQGWGIQQTKIPNTWKVTQGEGETVMVIDTGWSNHQAPWREWQPPSASKPRYKQPLAERLRPR